MKPIPIPKRIERKPSLGDVSIHAVRYLVVGFMVGVSLERYIMLAPIPIGFLSLFGLFSFLCVVLFLIAHLSYLFTKNQFGRYYENNP